SKTDQRPRVGRWRESRTGHRRRHRGGQTVFQLLQAGGRSVTFLSRRPPALPDGAGGVLSEPPFSTEGGKHRSLLLAMVYAAKDGKVAGATFARGRKAWP